MKVALIGATGFVGSAILNELVERGHQVTAIVRNPEKVKSAENITAVKANVLDENEVAEAVKNHDVVVNAFNPGWTNPNIYEEAMQGSQAIQSGVKKAGVKRLFVIGGAGSLYVAPNTQLIDTPQFPESFKAGASAARDYLNILKKEQDLVWTFLSPAIEMHQGTSGERRGKYRIGLENPVFDENNRSVISVEDMAIAIVDELENPKHIRQRFTVGY
ncbi:NAD(P)-dependent oxidoreductase [Adhaeribacter swui]|uniref:NAD(P)-dependent oxidoreductase n=1 Tax=Adhaeribacter swui TaxID=2086471 RepID=A0A7G7GA38_9BACT|nr:NAD(P)-dependent oxidoreductase [Adhaeribacter swui]QNF34022.1 NAD(P)-dependent oxidoreductase [Adhaeribacter swui]